MPSLSIGPSGAPDSQDQRPLPPAAPGTQTLAAAGLERGVDPRQADTRAQGDEMQLALLGRSRASQEAERTLKDHSLHGSFVSQFGQLMENPNAKIRIGVIDDFQKGTHGTNVEQRILNTVDESIRHRVEIVRYDVGGKDAEGVARVIAQAGRDAQDKKMLALSVSGGINAYKLDNIEKLIGGNELTKDNARQAYDAVIKNNGTSPTLQDAFKQLNLASGRIPVVTPVWNNDTTTLPALLLGSKSGNGIVTSIDKPLLNPADGQKYGDLYNGTEVPRMIDVRVPAAPGNPNTSQSAPYFIGNMINYALEKHPPRPNPQPGPRPTPRAAGEIDPAA